MVIRIDIEDPLERTQDFFNQIQGVEDDGYWDANMYKHIRLLSAEKTSPTSAKATFSLFIDQSLCNHMNNLHGGCAATILDCLTSISLAPISRPGFWQYGGVSRTINCTYLRPARLGTQTTVHCEVTHVGKRLAQIRGEIRGTRGELLCYIDHGKASIDPDVSKL